MTARKISIPALTNIIKIISLVYLLLISISLLSLAFKCFGSDFSRTLLQMTDNPFMGLLIGILSTSIIHSSSTTTSITVSMVASGVLSISNAVPIVMGAHLLGPEVRQYCNRAPKDSYFICIRFFLYYSRTAGLAGQLAERVNQGDLRCSTI